MDLSAPSQLPPDEPPTTQNQDPRHRTICLDPTLAKF